MYRGLVRHALGIETMIAEHFSVSTGKDDVGVICRKFNWREGDRTKLTDKTTNAVFVIEAMPPVTVEELASALSDLEELVQSHCGGEMRREILSTENPETLL